MKTTFLTNGFILGQNKERKAKEHHQAAHHHAPGGHLSKEEEKGGGGKNGLGQFGCGDIGWAQVFQAPGKNAVSQHGAADGKAKSGPKIDWRIAPKRGIGGQGKKSRRDGTREVDKKGIDRCGNLFSALHAKQGIDGHGKSAKEGQDIPQKGIGAVGGIADGDDDTAKKGQEDAPKARRGILCPRRKNKAAATKNTSMLTKIPLAETLV